MDIVAMIAENKIKEAMINGEFENLPNKGKPLVLEDLSHVPSDLRIGYKILKNAGVLPEELQLRKAIITIQDLIDSCHDKYEKNKLKKKLCEKILRFNILMDRKQINCNIDFYEDKIHNKLSGT